MRALIPCARTCLITRIWEPGYKTPGSRIPLPKSKSILQGEGVLWFVCQTRLCGRWRLSGRWSQIACFFVSGDFDLTDAETFRDVLAYGWTGPV